MVCKECFEKVKQEFIGKNFTDGAKIYEVLRHSPTSVFISKKDNSFQEYTPDFKLFFKTLKVLKNKKEKHETRTSTFSSKFCPNCGKKLEADDV